MAIFDDSGGSMPVVVCRAEEGFQPTVGTGVFKIPSKTQLFTVKQASMTLEETAGDTLNLLSTWDDIGNDTVQLCRGTMHRVRVMEAIKGPKKTTIWWYYGPTSKLVWDPGRLQWPEAKEFTKFSSNQGRELLRSQTRIPSVVEKKWPGILPANYKLRWNNTWDTERVKKEAGLMWMIWHKAVAVNAWRGVVSQEIDQSCVVCLKGIKETVLHCFWECAAAQRAWKWGEAIINSMAPAGVIRGSQAPAPNARMGNAYTSQSPSAGTLLPRSNSIAVDSQSRRSQNLTINWKQSIFGHRLPSRFKRISRVWLFLRGVVLWHIWEQRNEAAFDGCHWHPAKLFHKMWLSMIDYGRLSWARTQRRAEKVANNQEKSKKLLKDFQNSWCSKEVFAL